MTPETPKSRLVTEMLETASGMRDSGVIDHATYDKITMRHLDRIDEIQSLTGDEIRSLRHEARMSQAVFARCLNLTVGYISQLERGVKRPTGPALVLLNIIRRRGIESIR